MNFLAHVHLSGNNEELKIGNFIGDFVKGKDIELYSPAIQKGIVLHRMIDHFTDQHDIVGRSKKKLYDTYHKYAAVLIDVFYDHFLAKNWESYSSISLDSFTHEFYTVLIKHKAALPDRVQQFLPHLMQTNWLGQYHRLEGIEHALQRLARRARFNSGIEHALVDLKKNYQSLEEDFMDYYPKLLVYVEELL
jgi:acyl carrier protein phosphodiesterase